MTADDRLRAELETLERAAPDATPPIADGRPPRRRLGVGLVGVTVVVAAAVTLVSLGPLRSLPLGAVSPSPNPPARAETRVGDFILTVQSPQTVWTTDEPIDLSATLRYMGEEGEVTLGGGGIGISLIQQTGGDGELIAAFLGICRDDLYTISPGAPLNVPYQKGGVVNDVGPFDDAFFRDPELRLPTGRWLVIADANLGVDACDGLDLEVSLEIEVVEADGSPAPAPNPPAVAETRVGDFILKIASPQSHWGATEEVTITAVLTYVGTSDGTWISGSAKPVSIEIEQQSGGDESFTTAIPAPFFCDQLGEGLRLEDQWSRRSSEMGAGRWRATASLALDLHSTASGISDCDSGEPLGISVSIELEVGAVGQSDAAEPSEPAPPGRAIEVAGLRVMLPPGWIYRLPTFVSWGPAKPIIYFSNQPMHDECIRVGKSETCDRPIDELVHDGVLIAWWAYGDYPYPTSPPLPSGEPYELGGLDAVRHEADVELCGLQATEAEAIVVRRSDLARDGLTICSRDLTPATRAELEDLLTSIEFESTPPE